MMKAETFENVWDALADTLGEAANLKARAELMRAVADLIAHKRWKQSEAAAHLGVTQPRINDLLRGRIDKFSLDALINIAAAGGQRIRLEIVPEERMAA